MRITGRLAGVAAGHLVLPRPKRPLSHVGICHSRNPFRCHANKAHADASQPGLRRQVPRPPPEFFCPACAQPCRNAPVLQRHLLKCCADLLDPAQTLPGSAASLVEVAPPRWAFELAERERRQRERAVSTDMQSHNCPCTLLVKVPICSQCTPTPWHSHHPFAVGRCLPAAGCLGKPDSWRRR